MKFVLTFAKSDLTCSIIFGLDICQDLYRSTPKVLRCLTIISYSDIGVEGGVHCNRWVIALTQHFKLYILMTNIVSQLAGNYQPGGPEVATF